MPFEVFPIQPHKSEYLEEGEVIRGPMQVAQDLRDVYNKVAEQGGRIVGEHTVVNAGDRAYGIADKPWLFLVAELPEQPSQ